MANLRTNIMDFRGFDSSMILRLRGGILMSKGDFPESLSQASLVGIMLVGRLGVHAEVHMLRLPPIHVFLVSRYVAVGSAKRRMD